MAYVLGQYNHNKTSNDTTFMTLITTGTAKTRGTKVDYGVSGTSKKFYDPCVHISPLTFSNSSNYYFHGKIRRMSTEQTFYIKLISYSASATNRKEQYIRTIVVAQGETTDWVDVEFVFSPLSPFDCILFELQRIQRDYELRNGRTPVICYQELSEINNLITFSSIPTGTKLIKIGVQSRPGLLMCINGEEIRTCRTGVYEIKNGIITISFFSIVAGAEEKTTAIANWMKGSSISSKCFFDTDKTRTIDAFTLDYMYRDV